MVTRANERGFSDDFVMVIRLMASGLFALLAIPIVFIGVQRLGSLLNPPTGNGEWDGLHGVGFFLASFPAALIAGPATFYFSYKHLFAPAQPAAPAPQQAAVLAAFVKDDAGGNFAAVVLDAAKIPAARRQEIAAKLGLSETVFVEPAVEGFALSYFTPTTELDLCGHATIAAFAHLWEQKRVKPGITFIETKAGPLGIDVSEDGLIFMSQNLPVFGAAVDIEEVSASLGGARVTAARLVSTGLLDLLAEVESRVGLLALKPDLAKIAALTRRLGASSLHVFARAQGPVTAYCRDFGPAVGIDEEPATGTASGALACHLVDTGTPAGELVFIQGESLGRPSLIIARVASSGGRIDRIQIGGRAKLERTAIV